MSRGFPDPPVTLTGALERAARHFPERGIAVSDGRGRRFERRTFAELHAACRRSAARWAGLGLEPGDRVLVSLPTSWELLDAWLGALCRGALPVAVAPAGALGSIDAQARKLEDLRGSLAARFVVLSHGFREKMTGGAEAPLAGACVTPGELEGAPAGSFDGPDAVAGECAFLQLTSGSTGLPRGVMISHAGAIQNCLAIEEALGASSDGPLHDWAEALVGWLPLHHDMGMVGYFWLSVLSGIDLWLVPPTVFLARPRIWLELLSRGDAVVAHAPNFGYQLCCERLRAEDLEGLDLSGWRAAQTGAEMIRPETVTEFCDRFGPSGFRPHALQSTYGLAEATVGVSLDTRGEGLRTKPAPAGSGAGVAGSEVACVGAPLPGTEVRVVGPAGAPLDDGEVGEVCVRSPSLLLGYYGDPQATAEVLVDGWLHTGDLGFLDEGELYLTGRLKDILILRGTNFMPHELEWLAEAASGGGGALRAGAFSVARGGRGEEAVLVVETEGRDPARQEELEREIRLRVAHELGIQLAAVVFVRRGRIPRTTSGKVRRRKLRELYVRDELPALP